MASKERAGTTYETSRGRRRSYHASHTSILLLCTSLIALSSLPFADALHHMARKAPRRLERRKEPITPLLVTNNCGDTIWPGISTQSGKGPPENGFELQPGKTSNQTVSEDWQGRVWGRTNCSFNAQGTGPKNGGGRACRSGDCNGILNCQVGVRGSSSCYHYHLLTECIGRRTCFPRRVHS